MQDYSVKTKPLPKKSSGKTFEAADAVGTNFRRQYIIDDYVVDFVCVSKKLVVEVDGPTHEGREEYDAERTEHIGKRGYRVIRFTNAEVLDETDAVVEGIFQELQI